MQLKDVAVSLRRHWPVALALFVVIPFVVIAYLANRDVVTPPASYTTSADVLIPARNAKNGEAPEGVPPVLLQGQVELALSAHIRAVALRAAKVDPNQPNEIVFGAVLSESGDIMTLSVSAPRPEVAGEVLDKYVIAFADGRRQSNLDDALGAQEYDGQVVAVLKQKVADLEALLAPQGVPLPPTVPDGEVLAIAPGVPDSAVLVLYQRNTLLNEIVNRQVDYALQATRAVVPNSYTAVVERRSAARVTPPPPSPLVPLLVIIGVGLLLVGAVPVLIDRFDGTIRDNRAAAAALGSRLLGVIPAMPRRRQNSYFPARSPWDEAFRSLAATSISTGQLPDAILVSSPTDSSYEAVAANFAVSLASLGVTVALVGTAPRQRWFLMGADGAEEGEVEGEVIESRHEPPSGEGATSAPAGDEGPVGFDGGPGLTFGELLEEAHAGRLSTDVRSRLMVTDVPNLFIVPPPRQPVDLTLDGLPTLLEALSSDGVDTCVLAGPALLEDANATIIAWSTRSVLWVVEVGHSNVRDAQTAAERLGIAGVQPFGVALVSRHA